ncbi:MAG: bifunctional riboflavin kinase/FMN adenylyltransferase [Porticoccaceae bacterium]|nr:bifunctional riboflavin kinase/FMN adenylyltransferase [Porticoccaceae bacterium]
MTFVQNLKSLTAGSGGSAVSIGSFDGVHLGHQAVLTELIQQAKSNGLFSVAMTFEPQPREYFNELRAPARLMRLREKVEVLSSLGIDQIVCLKFNKVLRALSAQDFIIRVLVEGLRVKHLIVGDDFRFGCDRSGDFSMLYEYGKANGFSVKNTDTFESQGERISSTLVRRIINEGDFPRAAELLGRPFEIKGRVMHGKKLGRKLGFPTANININRLRAPLSGVYAVLVKTESEIFEGAANVGIRPTIGDLERPLLEVHIFNFDRDIYGSFLRVEFLHKIRDELKFNDLGRLVTRIQKDMDQIQKWFMTER